LEVLVSALWFPLRRLPDMALTLMILASGATMLWVAVVLNGMETGWDQATFWLGVLRATFSFCLGWAAWRYRDLAPRPPVWILAGVLLALLVMPILSGPGVPWNGIYDYACVLLLFPTLVACAAHDPGGRMGTLCRRAGDISYPLYALHWATWAVMLRIYPGGWQKVLPLWFPILALAACPLVGWAALRFYDQPARRRLSPT
ncbi:MAG: acyltransferase, partial [Caulobacter sp.]|nr:acyltransferase [Caulobacter sp.]